MPKLHLDPVVVSEVQSTGSIQATPDSSSCLWSGQSSVDDWWLSADVAIQELEHFWEAVQALSV